MRRRPGQNSAIGLDLGFYAARSYSLMRPPSTGRRWIRSWEKSPTGSLDGSSATVKNPGNLADLRDEAYFSGKLPAGSTDTHKHSAWGRVFALKTAGGGVLVFYALRAQLTLAPPPGQTFHVGIPGFYSSSQTLTSVTLGYAEQFATYIPPDQAGPQILADASGITARR